MTPLRIDFIADLSCPWCYVAWHALDKAIGARPDLAVERAWGVFLLRPDTPREGLDRAAVMAKIFAGQPEKARASRAALMAAAADADAPLNLDAATILPNTIDAHRLVEWATGQGAMERAVDALFAAYFVDGRNIGAPETLLDLAEGIGLDRAIVGDLLASDADWNRIADAHNSAVEAGIRGVPVTLFGGRFARQGAESVATYGQLLDAATA
jgi:predicted DsbA family dithiol-disulfide isomerase